MSALLLDGRITANTLLARLHQEVEHIQQQYNYQPGLAVIRIGEDPASKIYVTAKIRCAKELGITSWQCCLPASISENDLLENIHKLNADKAVNGILVQLPLPVHIDHKKVLNTIHPEKDVDGLHSINQGHLYSDEPGLYPCTPLGCHLLLQKYNINPAGKHVVVLGRSRLVGKPVAHMMLLRDATVTICHIKTPCISEFTKTADILISAVGQPGLVTANMVKEGVVILDIGITKTDQGTKGDVDFVGCAAKARAITPVPGGIGPMTVACLMYNTLIAASQQNNHHLTYIPDDPLRQSPWQS